MTIRHDGAVGIGTHNPQRRLHVSKSLNEGLTTPIVRFEDLPTAPDTANTVMVDSNGDLYQSNRFGASSGTTTINDNLNVLGNITSSNNISASTGVITNQINFTTAIVGGQASLTYVENTDIDTGTETIATLNHSTYDAGFFDYVLKQGTNMRAGTIMAVHDGTNIELTDISTADLGNTERVQFSASLDATNLILQAIVPSDNWSVRAYVRGI